MANAVHVLLRFLFMDHNSLQSCNAWFEGVQKATTRVELVQGWGNLVAAPVMHCYEQVMPLLVWGDGPVFLSDCVCTTDPFHKSPQCYAVCTVHEQTWSQKRRGDPLGSSARAWEGELTLRKPHSEPSFCAPAVLQPVSLR